MHHTYIDNIATGLLDLVGMFNSPKQDSVLLREAGVTLDRALFPLLVRIAAGPLSIADLAEQMDRDHSTVSRQVAKLEALSLIHRVPAPEDQRVRAAAITERGADTMRAIIAARRRLLGKLLAGWPQEDCETLARLNRKLADAMRQARAEWT